VRVRRRRALLAATLGVLVLVGLLFAFGYPTRTFLQQRSQISATQKQLVDLQRATAALSRQSQQLRGDAAVTRIAREQYGLVRPGEVPYVLVPAAPTTTPTTTPPTTTKGSSSRP
jgi:cell division protein FtsB